MGNDRFKASVLVSVQMICIILIAATGPLFAGNILCLAGELAGIALGLWALSVMGWRNFNVTPRVRQGAHLVTNGPYGRIRHPMYAAVLLAVWSLVIDRPTVLRVAIGLAQIHHQLLMRGVRRAFEASMERHRWGWYGLRRHARLAWSERCFAFRFWA